MLLLYSLLLYSLCCYILCHGVISLAVSSAGWVVSGHPEITPSSNIYQTRDTTVSRKLWKLISGTSERVELYAGQAAWSRVPFSGSRWLGVITEPRAPKLSCALSLRCLNLSACLHHALPAGTMPAGCPVNNQAWTQLPCEQRYHWNNCCGFHGKAECRARLMAMIRNTSPRALKVLP